MPKFKQINVEWNADPVDPHMVVVSEKENLIVRMATNGELFDRTDRSVTLIFTNTSKYRVGGPNDEGWYYGQCRYSGIAPQWGEFYEVGDCDFGNYIWSSLKGAGRKHFLFYMKDNTLEVFSDGVEFELSDKEINGL